MKRGALVQLKCAIQHYDWGVSGQTPSAVAELGSLNREEKINEEKRKLEVMVKIFGRKTPLELSYMQVEKL